MSSVAAMLTLQSSNGDLDAYWEIVRYTPIIFVVAKFIGGLSPIAFAVIERLIM